MSDTLELQSGVLNTPQIYVFTVTATDANGVNASSSIQITPARPPGSGQCAITPTTGVAFTTDFSIACWDWNDFYNPLQYSFALLPLDGDESEAFQFVGFSYQNNITSKLPNGTRTVVAYIRNTVGVYSEYWISVNVSSVDLVGGLFAYSSNLITSAINPTLLSHNLDRFTQGVMQIVDLLENTSPSSAQELQDRMTLRYDLTNRTRAFFLSSSYLNPYVELRLLKTLTFVASDPDEISVANSMDILSLMNETGSMLSESSLMTSNELPLFASGVGDDLWRTLVYADTVHARSAVSLNVSKLFIQYWDSLVHLIASSALNGNGMIHKTEDGLVSVSELQGRSLITYRNEYQSFGPIHTTVGVPVDLDSQLSFTGTAFSGSPTALLSIVVVTWRDILTMTQTTGSIPEHSVSTTSVIFMDANNTPFSVPVPPSSSNPLPNFDDPTWDYGPNGNAGHTLLNLSILHQPDELPNRTRICRYWDEVWHNWSTAGTTVDYVNSKPNVTYCLANHATTFDVEFANFAEVDQPLVPAAIGQVSTNDVRKEPATLIFIFILFALFLVSLFFVLYKDRHDRDDNRIGARSEFWRLEIKNYSKNPITYIHSVHINLQQKTVWFGPFLRRFGDNHTSFQRIVVLVTMLYFVAALTAICYGTFSYLRIGAIAAISALVALTIAFVIQYFFTHAGDESLYIRLHRGKLNNVDTERKLRLIDKDYALSRNRLSAAWTWMGYIWIISIIIICLICLIVYGVRFSYDRSGLSFADTSWSTPQSGLIFDGPIIRESYDSAQECQISCLSHFGCTGVTIRNTDGKCFEMGGNLQQRPEIWYADTSVMTDLRTPVWRLWLGCFFLSVFLTLLFEMFLVWIFVTLVWLTFNGPIWVMTITNKENPRNISSDIEMKDVKRQPPIDAPSELEPASIVSSALPPTKPDNKDQEQPPPLHNALDERVARAIQPLPRDSMLSMKQAKNMLQDLKELKDMGLISNEVAEKRQKEILISMKSAQQRTLKPAAEADPPTAAVVTPGDQPAESGGPPDLEHMGETDYVIEEQLPALEGEGSPAQNEEAAMNTDGTISTLPALEPSWGQYVPADLSPPPLENAEPAIEMEQLDMSDNVVDLEEQEGEADVKYGPLTSQPTSPTHVESKQVASPSGSLTSTPVRPGPGAGRGGRYVTRRHGDIPKIMKDLSVRGVDTQVSRYPRKSQIGRMLPTPEETPEGSPARSSVRSGPPTPNTPNLPNTVPGTGARAVSTPSVVQEAMETDEY